MRSLQTLGSLFLLFAFTSHPTLSASLAIGEAALRSEVDLSDLSDLPEGEDVVEDVVEREMFNELDEDDMSENALMPAGFLRLSVRYRCVYDRIFKKIRCFPIRLRH